MDYTPSTNINPGSTITVAVGLNKYKDREGNIYILNDKLPDYGNVTFEFSDGTKQAVAVEKGLAKIDYG